MKFLKFFTLLLFIERSRCAPVQTEIEYAVLKSISESSDTVSLHKGNVVINTENTTSILILSDIPTLKKGILDISADTKHFSISRKNLEVIEPDAFDNQNITEEISLVDNELSVISTGTFKNLKIKILDLSYNQITHLEEDAISDLPNLEKIFLTGNKISHFAGNWIENTPQLWVFDMSYNNLTKLGERFFTFMSKDKAVQIDLGHNKIGELHPKAFEGITVSTLYLHSNEIKQIPPDIFVTDSIDSLLLSDNQLETLPEEFFNQTNLSLIYLRKNPLHCDVVDKLEDFVKQANISWYFLPDC